MVIAALQIHAWFDASRTLDRVQAPDVRPVPGTREGLASTIPVLRPAYRVGSPEKGAERPRVVGPRVRSANDESGRAVTLRCADDQTCVAEEDLDSAKSYVRQFALMGPAFAAFGIALLLVARRLASNASAASRTAKPDA